MKPLEIEGWARRICERVAKGQPVEDTRVELKAVWLDAVKAARRIAGHANAARGESILWLIGVDEKTGVVGAAFQELSNWWAQVRSEFESEVPNLQDLSVDINGKTVAALCFDTSRFPYVVKNPERGGAIKFEVPWREGTAVRSATRGDLVLMLSPLINSPKLEILGGTMSLVLGGVPSFEFCLELYVIPRGSEPVCFPVHKCAAKLTSGNVIVSESFGMKFDTSIAQAERKRQDERERHIRDAQRHNRPFSPNVAIKAVPDTIEISEDELIIRGPGKILLSGRQGWAIRYSGEDDLTLCLTMVEAISELSLVLRGTFSRIKDARSKEEPNRWALKM